jgi:Putative zinc-finger
VRLRDNIDVFDLDSDGMGVWIPGRKMMNCKEVVDVLSDYLANELSADGADGVRTHLRKCRNCKAFMASLRTTIKWTHDLKTEDVPLDVVNSVRTFLKSKIGTNGMSSDRKKVR